MQSQVYLCQQAEHTREANDRKNISIRKSSNMLSNRGKVIIVWKLCRKTIEWKLHGMIVYLRVTQR